jgi:transcriptional regulator with XRE-family HTH domain
MIEGMTGDQMRAWRKRLDLHQAEAAARLGLSSRSIQLYEAGEQPVPRSVALACAALELGLEAYDGEPLVLRAGPLTLKGGD